MRRRTPTVTQQCAVEADVVVDIEVRRDRAHLEAHVADIDPGRQAEGANRQGGRARGERRAGPGVFRGSGVATLVNKVDEVAARPIGDARQPDRGQGEVLRQRIGNDEVIQIDVAGAVGIEREVELAGPRNDRAVGGGLGYRAVGRGSRRHVRLKRGALAIAIGARAAADDGQVRRLRHGDSLAGGEAGRVVANDQIAGIVTPDTVSDSPRDDDRIAGSSRAGNRPTVGIYHIPRKHTHRQSHARGAGSNHVQIAGRRAWLIEPGHVGHVCVQHGRPRAGHVGVPAAGSVGCNSDIVAGVGIGIIGVHGSRVVSHRSRRCRAVREADLQFQLATGARRKRINKRPCDLPRRGVVIG